MTFHLKFLATILLALLPFNKVFACKHLVKFPEHLAVSPELKKSTYVVKIIKPTLFGYEAIILQSFGGNKSVFEHVIIEYKTPIQPGEYCYTKLNPGDTYLLGTTAKGNVLVMINHNGLAIISNNPLFDVYVNDLKQ